MIKINPIGNELVKLYKDLEEINHSKEVEKVKKRMEDNLYLKMRENFLELLEIGNVIGYQKLEGEM